VYNVGKGRIGDDLTVTSGNLTVTITGQKKPISVKSYGATQPKKGLSFRMLKQGKRSTVASGFLSKKNGTPFKRVGKSRLPIKVVSGPSVADMLNRDTVQKPLTQNLADRAIKEISRRIGRLRG